MLGADGLIYQVRPAALVPFQLHVRPRAPAAPALQPPAPSLPATCSRLARPSVGAPPHGVLQGCMPLLRRCPQDVADLVDCGRDLNPNISVFDDSCFTGVLWAETAAVSVLVLVPEGACVWGVGGHSQLLALLSSQACVHSRHRPPLTRQLHIRCRQIRHWRHQRGLPAQPGGAGARQAPCPPRP